MAGQFGQTICIAVIGVSGGVPSVSSQVGGLSSVSDTGTGNATANFSPVLPFATRCVTLTIESNSAYYGHVGNSPTSALIELFCRDDAGSVQDPTAYHLLVTRAAT